MPQAAQPVSLLPRRCASRIVGLCNWRGTIGSDATDKQTGAFRFFRVPNPGSHRKEDTMATTQTATPPLTKTTLWTAREGGYYNYRIPGLCVTPGGVVLAYCEARRDDGGDHDVIDILMRRSLDGGATWSASACVVNHAAYPQPTMNNYVCLPDRETGETHALFCNRYRRAYHCVSRDDGATWSDPVEITGIFEGFRADYDWQLCAFGPGHGFQHSSGRLISPVWLSLAEDFHLPNRAGAVTSEDHGKTWQAGGLVPDTPPNCNETTGVELADGRVLFNLRSHAGDHRRFQSISPDGRGAWSFPTPVEELTDPICHASLVRHGSGALLFSNPKATSRDLPGCWEPVYDRKNLTVRVSHDEGASYSPGCTLEAGPSGYSDLAVLPNGTILCLYEDGMVERMADTARLTVATFHLDWVSAGE